MCVLIDVAYVVRLVINKHVCYFDWSTFSELYLPTDLPKNISYFYKTTFSGSQSQIL